MGVSTASLTSGWQNLVAVTSQGSLSGNSVARTVIAHDFATGSFSVPLALNPSTMHGGNLFQLGGWYPGGKMLLGNLVSDMRYVPTQFNSQRLFRGVVPGGHSVLFDKQGLGNPADFVVEVTNPHESDGLKSTRTFYTDDPISYGTTLVGPYTMEYTTPGLHNPSMVLYSYQITQNSQGYTATDYRSFTGNEYVGNTTPSGQGYYADVKRFYIDLRQRVISIVKKDSPSGASIVDGQSITGMNPVTNATIVLDKSLSRYPSVGGSSTWEITTQSLTGAYVTATPGVDYNLGGGETLSNNLIHLTWLVSGNHRVTNVTADPGKQTAARLDIEFPVNTQTVNTINFPTIISTVTASSAFTNRTIGTNPLTGTAPYEVTVTSALNLIAASWTQQVDANPLSNFILSEAEWKIEIESRLAVRCYLRQNGIVTQLKYGLGPHNFTILEGTYEVGFATAPKSSLPISIDDILNQEL